MNLIEYYKNNPNLLTWTIVIFVACAVIGIASIFIRKWLRNKKMEKPLVIHPTEKDLQVTDGEEPADAIEIYDEENKEN